ncbi:glycosyltransferase family 2 protein [Paracoccaceae bacterium GXU_MW_L88]
MPPVISVIIPNYNSEQQLEETLRRLSVERETSGIAAEIIVVDNGSEAPPEALCAQYNFVTLAHEPTPGPGPARSKGAALARGTYLAFIDADCYPMPGWLTAVKEGLDSGVDVVGGDVRIAFRNPEHLDMIEAYEAVYGYNNKHYVTVNGYTGTGNMGVRAASFAKVGDFAGLSVAEDIDWGKRAKAAGLTIRYLPDMIVETPARESYDELIRKWDRHIAHLYEARSSDVKWALRGVAMALSPPAEILRVAKSTRISGLRARWLAWICVTRTRFYRARRMLELAFGRDADALAARWRDD